MGNKVCIDGIWYCLNKEIKEATVTRSDNKEEKYQGEVVIPEVVVYEGEGYAVTHINGLAFYGCSELTSITISESVKKIESSAFCGCI